MKTRTEKIAELRKQITSKNKKLGKIEAEILTHGIKLKDTSYRRSGGYFGTNKADTSDTIIFKSFARTKHLNTYLCVTPEYAPLVKQHQTIANQIVKLTVKLATLQGWIDERTQMIEAIRTAKNQVKDGTVNTSYVKHFIVGNRNVYGAHPYYQHRDYNKYRAFPANERGIKLATMLNNYMERNTVNKEAQIR